MLNSVLWIDFLVLSRCVCFGSRFCLPTVLRFLSDTGACQELSYIGGDKRVIKVDKIAFIADIYRFNDLK